MQRFLRVTAIVAAALAFSSGIVLAVTDGSGDPAPVKLDGGQWTDKEGNPTFKVDNGSVDWATYIGFNRYSSECLRCHGPDGLGSTYAPALTDSLKHMTYMDFYATVASGKKAISSSQDLVMPALGGDKNVMCFVAEIYTYLRARSDGAVGRGRPSAHAPKPAGFEKNVDDCMG